MKTIAALALVLAPLAACAASSAQRPLVADEPISDIEVVLVSDTAIPASAPVRTTAATTPPAADRLAHQVQVELGGIARTDLRLCVGGDGSVTSARVARSSGISELDDVLTQAALGWRYQPLAAADAKACHNVEISYRVP